MNAKEFDGGFRARLEALATSSLSDACCLAEPGRQAARPSAQAQAIAGSRSISLSRVSG